MKKLLENEVKKSRKIRSVNEVELIYKRPVLEGAYRVKTSQDAEVILRKTYDLNRIDFKEFFYVILMSRYNQVLCVAQISSGSNGGTVVNIPEIIQLALLRNSVGIIISHNHPSGCLKPSENDLDLTKRIQNACKLFDIKVLDHVIITSESYYSFADECIL